MSLAAADLLGQTIRQRVVDSVIRDQRDLARRLYEQAPQEHKETCASVAAGLIVMAMYEGPFSRPTTDDRKSAHAAELARIKA